MTSSYRAMGRLNEGAKKGEQVAYLSLCPIWTGWRVLGGGGVLLGHPTEGRGTRRRYKPNIRKFCIISFSYLISHLILF